MPNYVLLALESALSVFGMRSIYEQPKYEVLATVGMVEIRRYAPRVAAEVTVVADSEKRARNEAFGILAGYILGGNRDKADIAMTSPVATAPEGRKIATTSPVETRSTSAETAITAPPEMSPGGSRRYTQRFYLPKSLTRENAPVPNDAGVSVVEVPEETIAALTFSGRGTEETLTRRKRELLAQLANSSWQPVEEPGTFFYDPPFTIPWLRRNEVAARVEAALSEVRRRSASSASRSSLVARVWPPRGAV